jgi:hypothetical protein
MSKTKQHARKRERKSRGKEEKRTERKRRIDERKEKINPVMLITPFFFYNTKSLVLSVMTLSEYLVLLIYLD